MRSLRRHVVPVLGIGSLLASPARAGEHTWDVWEVFSNADGSVQFIELRETQGGTMEFGVNGNSVSVHPSGNSFTIPNPALTGDTSFKSYLLATAAFAALPGAPTPNQIIPANFIVMATDNQARFNPWDTASWTAGTLPTDGIRSLSRSTLGGPLEEVTNSPTNYAGATGTIDASGGPALPGVPGLLVGKITPDGGSLSVSWDVAACTGEADHQILYGQKSGFPAIAGGTYTLAGGQCSIGTTSPFAWSPAPSASDGSGLLWFLVVAENNAGTEGPWGKDKAGAERNGSGPGGSSAVCAITGKNLANACGQ